MNLGKSNGKPISSLFSSSSSSSVHSSCLSILSCLYFSVHRIPPPPSPHHINFSPDFFLLACTIVMFSFSFPPPSRNQLICHTDRSWGCHQLRRILFILLSIYRKSRKIRYFGCRSKRLLFLIILLFSRLLDSSPLHPRLLSSNGLCLRENFTRILLPYPRINDSFKDQLRIM